MTDQIAEVMRLAKAWAYSEDCCLNEETKIASTALEAAICALAASPSSTDDALGYATRLAQAIHAKHYGHVTQWRALPDLLGVLTQIDNMTSGLVAASPPAARTRSDDEILTIRVCKEDGSPYRAMTDQEPGAYTTGETLAQCLSRVPHAVETIRALDAGLPVPEPAAPPEWTDAEIRSEHKAWDVWFRSPEAAMKFSDADVSWDTWKARARRKQT